jgi:hypothetical protein
VCSHIHSLYVHLDRCLNDIEWIDNLVTMPPLWLLRYAYFVRSANDSRLQAKSATNNLDSYVKECWDLKRNDKLDQLELDFTPYEQAIDPMVSTRRQCQHRYVNDWTSHGMCAIEQMPNGMLEQLVVLSTICIRW